MTLTKKICLFLLFFGFNISVFGQKYTGAYDSNAINLLINKIRIENNIDSINVNINILLNMADSSEQGASLKALVYELKAEKSDSSQYESLVYNALSFYELGMDSINMSRVLKTINQYHFNRREFAKTLITGQKLVALYDFFNDNLAMSTTYNQMGEVSAYLGDTLKALQYFESAKNKIALLPDEIQFITPWINKSVIYLGKKQLDSAQIELEEPIKIFASKDKMALQYADILILLSQIDISKNNYDACEKKLEQALKIFQHHQNQYGLLLVYSKFLALYTELDEKQSADYYALAGDKIISNENIQPGLMNYDEQMLIFKHLTNYYEIEQDFEKAFFYASKINSALSQINSKEELQNLLQSQISTATENAKIKASLLERENQFNQITIERQKYTNYFAIIFSIAILGLAAFTYNTYLKNKKITQELKVSSAKVQDVNANLEKIVRDRTLNLLQTQKELDQFLYHASHDLRRPLTSFFGLVDIGFQNTDNEAVVNVLELIQSNAKDMDKLVLNLRLLSELYYVENKKEYVDVLQLIEEVKLKFKNKIADKDIFITYDAQAPNEIYSFKPVVHAILEKTIENSIDFASSNKGKIVITMSEQTDGIEIIISDNGQGISPLIHEKIYDMYYRGNEESKGNGLGLYIVKKAVELMNGSITLQSELNEGSTFTIRLS